MRSTAIVTGASKGIGYELALNLVRRGINVIAVARNEDGLKTLKSFNPDRIYIISADVGTEKGRNDVMRKTNEFGFNKIDYLVNNAAIIGPLKNMEYVSEDEFTNLLNINLYAALFLSSKLLPLLSGGRILNVSSRAEDIPTAGAGAYAISKAALKMATRVQQLEYTNVAVNSVIPGEVETNMQVELRNSDHPLNALFKECSEKGALMPAFTCAAFLSYLLLDVNVQDFKNNEWQIYDIAHRNKWLTEDMLLPMPYVPYVSTKAMEEKQRSSTLSTTTTLNQSFTLLGKLPTQTQSMQESEKNNLTCK